ncbi:MAG: 1,4-alpha-glucan branching protein domain-containing protein, partial [Planctomycetota bacterium]
GKQGDDHLSSHSRHPSATTVTPSEYLAEYPRGQESMPAESTWGHGGYHDVWLSGSNDWIYPRVAEACRTLSSALSEPVSARSSLETRALDQAARELLLAQSSDWAFILRAGTSTGYARRRVVEHLEAFETLCGGVAEGTIDEVELARLEQRNNVFPELTHSIFEETPVSSENRADRPLHIAFLAAEMAPLVKVGGLADVAGALPSALSDLGMEVTVVLPAYRAIDREKYDIRVLREGLSIPFGGGQAGFSLLEAKNGPRGIRLLLVEHNAFFDRPGVYVDPNTKEEYPDTAQRFVFFTRAALEGVRSLGREVDVVHSHDHQTALASAYVKMHYADDPLIGGAVSVYTLHNLGYQGIYPPAILDDAGFGQGQCYPGSYFEYYGNVNFMKVGICFADRVSTVSESYAREICEDETQSAGLAPLLLSRRGDLSGIVNGIDMEDWNPEGDPHTAAPYNVNDRSGKRECKRALMEEVGLDTSNLDVPLIGVVTRLVDQKGLDLIEEIFDRLMEERVQFVLLGTGLPKYEDYFAQAPSRYPGRVASLITFNNGVAHRIEAGSDMFLMPSLYEPCGLNQLYSLRYGTVPVVRSTGGLADTVPDADTHDDGVGFSFHDYSGGALLETLRRAIRAYEDSGRWEQIVTRGMSLDLSWTVSAKAYESLYLDAMTVRS